MSSKFELRAPEVQYVGHVISKDGLKVSPEKVRAIQEMPAPTDVAGVKRVLGLVQYLAKFIPNLSDVSDPLRILVKNDVQWHWNREQQQSFDELKRLVSTAPVLRFYNVDEPVTVSVDASSKGLGVVLLQNGQPVAYGSKALSETQKRYAQIEREMLAILYGCQKFDHYIYGRRVVIETDHKPLVAIYEKPLYRATPRLQRMLMKLQRYDLRIVYVPGKEMYISDTLSRAFLSDNNDELIDDEFDVSLVETQLPISSAKLAEFKDSTAVDDNLCKLSEVVVSGWPNRKEMLPEGLQKYWNFRDEITVLDGLLYKSQRIMVPKTLQREMLVKLHESHLGIVKTKQRAREILFWCNMNNDIQHFISNCSICNKFRKANTREPLKPHDIPSRPWTKLGADLMEFKGKHYLLCVDYYSKYPEIALLPSLSSASTISAFKSMFARHGIPMEVVSDNGPQFACASFRDFAKEWDFIHTTSSPRYPQSNGEAERFVQTVKDMFKKAEHGNSDVYVSLMEYRASPIDGVRLSPAQLLMNRQLRTKLPVSSELLKPEVVKSKQKELVERQKSQKFYYDKKSKPLPEVSPGEIVRFKKDIGLSNWEPAVVETDHGERSFILRSENDKLYRRNRRHILKTGENVFQKQETQFDNDFQISENANDTNTPKFDQQETATSAASDQPMGTRSGRISKKSAYLEEYYV